MKKNFAVLLICSALLPAFMSCGDSGKVPKKTSETVIKEPDGQIDSCKLRFSWWGGDDRHKATLKAIDIWNELHPEIEIIPEYGGWDGWSEKVSAQINSHTEPDIMQINYDWLVSFSPDGKGFYDLNKLTDYLDFSGFTDEVLSFGKSGGVLNAVTVSVTGRGFFYNSEVYRRMGAEYPETWEDLISLGEKFSDENIYPLDLDIQSGGTAWYLAVVYVQQKTGREFISMDGKLGFTENDIKTALDFYKTLEDGGVIRSVETRTDEDGNVALYQSPEFIEGSVAGVLEWGSSVGKYEMVLPEGVLEAGNFLSDENGNTGGWMVKPSMLYAISANTEYPDEAALFMDFLLNNEEAAVAFGTTRGIPASAHAEKALEDRGLLTGLAQKNDEMIEKLDTVTISPYMELPRMKEFYNSAIEEISYNQADTSAVAEELYNSINSYLNKIKVKN